DGFEAAHLIRERERTRHVPIIFVTAYTRNDTEILKGYRLGASDFLFKPIVPEVLRAKARIFVELQERSSELRRQAERLREMRKLEMEREIAVERERWKMEAALEENRRKDEFIAELAHELRNPLSPIVTSIDLLEIHGKGQPGIERVRYILQRQTNHLMRLIDDLLDVARISSGKINVDIGRVGLTEAVEQATGSVADLIEERGHKLTVTAPTEPLTVAADPVRLTQIITNLLNNAARYTNDGGEIELDWGRQGGEAVIRVTDSGRGIPAEMLERIFEQFVQVNNRGPGLGLGLALVQRLVEIHGGRIRAESAGRDKGSTFTVWLPLAEEAAATAERKSPVAAGVPAARLNVVLVDDEADIRESFKTLLESWGHRVRTASDGTLGLELIGREKPDVAVIDIAMPGLDGYAIAREVRAQADLEHIRLIAMTGFGRDNDRERAMQAGFDLHLTKPARPEELQAALQS
ncbi:MAG: response regulator, partial [Gammaproteobacteria bacterium]